MVSDGVCALVKLIDDAKLASVLCTFGRGLTHFFPPSPDRFAFPILYKKLARSTITTKKIGGTSAYDTQTGSKGDSKDNSFSAIGASLSSYAKTDVMGTSNKSFQTFADHAVSFHEPEPASIDDEDYV